MVDETDELEPMFNTVHNSSSNNNNINLPTITTRPITSTITSKEINSLLRSNDHIQVESIDEGTGSLDCADSVINANQPSCSASKYTLSDLHDMAPKRTKVYWSVSSFLKIKIQLAPPPPAPVQTPEQWRCHCKKPTVQKRSTKANENFNRAYRSCAINKCRFFRWEPRGMVTATMTLAATTSSNGSSSSLTRKAFTPPPIAPSSATLNAERFDAIVNDESSFAHVCIKVANEPRDPKHPWKTSFSSLNF